MHTVTGTEGGSNQRSPSTASMPRDPDSTLTRRQQLAHGPIAGLRACIGAGERFNHVVKFSPAADELAPGLSVPAGTPPVFLVHGSDDISSPPETSVVMYLALKKAGVPAELHLYAGTTHDFGVRPSDRPFGQWTDSCARWLKSQGFLPAGR